jgi:hypothetical protein
VLVEFLDELRRRGIGGTHGGARGRQEGYLRRRDRSQGPRATERRGEPVLTVRRRGANLHSRLDGWTGRAEAPVLRRCFSVHGGARTRQQAPSRPTPPSEHRELEAVDANCKGHIRTAAEERTRYSERVYLFLCKVLYSSVREVQLCIYLFSSFGPCSLFRGN